jgi:hypothetical protein
MYWNNSVVPVHDLNSDLKLFLMRDFSIEGTFVISDRKTKK